MSDAERRAVEAAAAAAEDLIFSRLSRSDVEDFDVTVSVEEGTLSIEVYIEAPDVPDADQIADDAALAAHGAADEILREEEQQGADQ